MPASLDMKANATPAFRKPPVVEVAVGVQFEPLERLGVAQLGLLWSRYRNRYPITEHHPPIAPVNEVIEEVVLAQPEIRFEPKFPVPRCWFLTTTKTQLIQVQQDRFLVNWRRLETGEEYPSYRKIRAVFESGLDEFRDFLSKEDLGDITPNNCEVTYVNHLPKGEGWDKPGELHKILALWSGRHSDSFLSEPEDVDVGIRYVMRDRTTEKPIGRLHAKLNSAIRRADSKRVLVLNITARVRTQAVDSDVLQCLDHCHEWAVKGFASITSDAMHQRWERLQ